MISRKYKKTGFWERKSGRLIDFLKSIRKIIIATGIPTIAVEKISSKSLTITNQFIHNKKMDSKSNT
jgi:hypothetical protein